MRQASEERYEKLQRDLESMTPKCNVNMIENNIIMIKAGTINERKIDIANEKYVLEPYNPSPRTRVLTE